jgi:hypothetical protein
MNEDAHLDLVALDLLRRGEGSDEDRPHADACAQCRAGLADLRTLAAGLQEQLGAAPVVPDTIERKILWLAQAEAARVRGLRRGGVRRVAEAPATRWAVAAALLLAFAVLVTQRPVPLAGDVNGDRRVDILDAFQLSRAVAAGAPRRASWDMDADGRIDRADVDAIARTAVALGEPT